MIQFGDIYFSKTREVQHTLVFTFGGINPGVNREEVRGQMLDGPKARLRMRQIRQVTLLCKVPAMPANGMGNVIRKMLLHFMTKLYSKNSY